MTSKLKVSVIVVVRNDPRIVNCLTSVFTQDFPDEEYQVIVVDNNSDDETPNLIQRFPVHFLTERRIGMCWARNRGLEEAQGEIIAFTDADCVVSATWLRELVAGFDTEYIGGVGGTIVKLDEPGRIRRAARDLAIGQQREPQHLPMFHAPYIVTANAAYQADVLRQIDGFDPQFFSGGDVDIAWRVQIAGYKLKLVRGAIVYHASRSTWREYFRQFYQYGLGHALLFKKYRQYTHQKVLINVYPFRELLRLCLRRIPVTFTRSLGHGFQQNNWIRLGLDLTEYVALICGDVVGAIRFRVPYL
jgi:GT2 family glycosyltransferase